MCSGSSKFEAIGEAKRRGNIYSQHGISQKSTTDTKTPTMSGTRFVGTDRYTLRDSGGSRECARVNVIAIGLVAEGIRGVWGFLDDSNSHVLRHVVSVLLVFIIGCKLHMDNH